MTYQAQRRLQITLEDGSAPAERTHEDRGDQTPLCKHPTASAARSANDVHAAGAGRGDLRKLRPRARLMTRETRSSCRLGSLGFRG